MKLVALLERDDLAGLLDELLPARIQIGDTPRRSVSLSKPALVELVPGQGLRVRGSARVAWEIAGIGVTPRVRSWQLLLTPKIVLRRGAAVLAFEPSLEELDFEVLPGFADNRIADAINAAIASYQQKLVWQFEKTLSVKFALPTQVAPRSRVSLAAKGGDVEVTEAHIGLTVLFEARVARPGQGARRAPAPVPPASA